MMQPALIKSGVSSGRAEARIGEDTARRYGTLLRDAMPPMQAEVVRFRDVSGWSSDAACNALDLTEPNQRVLLYRGRSRIRRQLSTYLSEGQDR